MHMLPVLNASRMKSAFQLCQEPSCVSQVCVSAPERSQSNERYPDVHHILLLQLVADVLRSHVHSAPDGLA